MGKSPTLISRVELGHPMTLSEETVCTWAEAVGGDADYALALVGKIPSDIVKTITDKPELWLELLRSLRRLPKTELAAVVRRVKDGDW
jgi:hypothetical protein